MNTDPQHCSACGTVLDASAPGGLCPRCLLAGAMQPTEPAGTDREPPSIAEVGAAFPQLEIVALVGQGGMGWVFKARQPKLNRLVALKLLPASLAERDAAFAGRFEREGQLLARLHHPNIVAVHDSGAAGGFFYLLMEFVEGVNLRQAMRSARFTPAQALAIVPHICDALQFAHDEGVLHRDIKPENILLDAKGRVKLADFGIAKLMGDGPDESPATHADQPANFTHAGTTLGTPSYMAPEQRDTPADVDHRADIYSLGVVFYELLTGELPVGKFAPPSEISASDPRVDAIVRQALEKERDRRQQSAGEMKTQVETVAGNPAMARLLETDSAVDEQDRLCTQRFGRVRLGIASLLALPICILLAAAFAYFAPREYLARVRIELKLDPAGIKRLHRQTEDKFGKSVEWQDLGKIGLHDARIYDRSPQKATDEANAIAWFFHDLNDDHIRVWEKAEPPTRPVRPNVNAVMIRGLVVGGLFAIVGLILLTLGLTKTGSDSPDAGPPSSIARLALAMLLLSLLGTPALLAFRPDEGGFVLTFGALALVLALVFGIIGSPARLARVVVAAVLALLVIIGGAISIPLLNQRIALETAMLLKGEAL